jgi:hypothetical protein
MKIILLLVIFFLLTNKSYAYLDPGTGSIILQVLAVVLASTIAFFKFFYQKFKNLVKKIKNYLIVLLTKKN